MQNSFHPYERFRSWTRFETEAQKNSGNGPLVYQNFVERKLTVSAGKCTLARIKKLTEIFLKTQSNGPY